MADLFVAHYDHALSCNSKTQRDEAVRKAFHGTRLGTVGSLNDALRLPMKDKRWPKPLAERDVDSEALDFLAGVARTNPEMDERAKRAKALPPADFDPEGFRFAEKRPGRFLRGSAKWWDGDEAKL